MLSVEKEIRDDNKKGLAYDPFGFHIFIQAPYQFNYNGLFKPKPLCFESINIVPSNMVKCLDKVGRVLEDIFHCFF